MICKLSSKIKAIPEQNNVHLCVNKQSDPIVFLVILKHLGKDANEEKFLC